MNGQVFESDGRGKGRRPLAPRPIPAEAKLWKFSRELTFDLVHKTGALQNHTHAAACCIETRIPAESSQKIGRGRFGRLGIFLVWH